MQVEIVSDNICPWCFIGKHHFDQAVTNLGLTGVEARWRPYQLYPGIPREGVPRKEFMQARFGSSGGEAFQRITEVGREAGIEFRFGELEKIPNTLDSHRLLEYAATEGKQHETVEALMSAGFEQARDIGCREVLLEVAGEAGLELTAVETMLSSTDYAEDVRESVTWCQNAGISGVPLFRFASGEILQGAQPVKMFEMFLRDQG